jgi:DNA-binding transcriptional ArsR family regulator
MAIERDKRSPVLDLSAPAAVEVEIDVSEAAEVLMSICAVSDRDDHDTFDLGEEWLRARLDAVPEDLRDTVDELMLGKLKLAAHLLGIVLETPKPRTFASFLERLEGTDPVELKLHLFGAYGSQTGHLSAPDVIERAARGDSEAREEFLASLVEYSDKYESVRTMLEADGEEIKARLLALLPRWYEGVFLPYEPEWREAAERDAGVKRELARSNSPTQLTELATRGYQYAPVPGIRTLAFFPSWWMRPWVVLWEHRGTKIFCYPIASPAEEGASPAEVARVYKALGDEGRLKLLRRLSDGSLTLAEAAEELGVAKSTAHHHLAILRQAGFVTVREDDDKVYNLRDDRPETGDLLAAYLGASRSSSTIA